MSLLLAFIPFLSVGDCVITPIVPTDLKPITWCTPLSNLCVSAVDYHLANLIVGVPFCQLIFIQHSLLRRGLFRARADKKGTGESKITRSAGDDGKREKRLPFSHSLFMKEPLRRRERPTWNGSFAGWEPNPGMSLIDLQNLISRSVRRKFIMNSFINSLTCRHCILSYLQPKIIDASSMH